MADIKEVLANIGGCTDAAWNGSGDRRKVFESEDGHTIMLEGSVYEPGWESFSGTCHIYEDGVPVFWQDAQNVDNYHNEVYTRSIMTSKDDAVRYLSEKYAGVTFNETDKVPDVTFNGVDLKWSNPAYAKEVERRSQPPERIVFEDQGVVRSEAEDSAFHKVVFARACDMKTFGKDASVPNPYIVNRTGRNGTFHAVYLNDAIYDRLMRYANKDGLSDSKWTGVINADVRYDVSGKHNSASVDLRADAVKKGRVERPAFPFDEVAHDSFVKQSVKELRASRRLPDAPAADNETQSESQYE